jgi:hypothetical protein
MKEAIKKSLLILLPLAVGAAYGFSQTEQKTVRLLEDPDTRQWCAYSNESIWNMDVQSLAASSVGGLIYEDGRLIQIIWTQSDESGDWTVFDRYFVDHNGQPERLERITNVLPGDRSVKDVFLITGGKLSRRSRAVSSLSTNKAAQLGSTWLPNIPVRVATKNFPFSMFIGRTMPSNSRKTCLPAVQ